MAKGWLTTDAEELARRRERAAAERFVIEALTPEQDPFGTYRIRSEKGSRTYRVEIRSHEERDNTCTCRDFLHNGLGTCKHIEAVRLKLGGRGDSPRSEVFLRRRGGEPRILLRGSHPALNAFFSHGISGSELSGDPVEVLPELERAVTAHPDELRLSEDVVAWTRHLERRRQRDADRAAYTPGRDPLKEPLYPFQEDGMLHLAFGERAMLADDLGLGKTVQALAATELLRQLRGIERVLVVCPASLKAQWADQVERFSGLTSQLVSGPRTRRRRAYRNRKCFYTIAHYEQVRSDAEDINHELSPDLVILDEAQRIKSWNTKTARAVKQLSSRYAFVLTGTPLENRIDEIYSIAEFLDPQLFGPLFRFNREFYQFDTSGRPVGFKNLPELHRRVQSILLRRQRGDVQAELPALTIETYSVGMTPRQRRQYAAQQDKVLALAKETWTGTTPLADPLPPALERLRRLCNAAEENSAEAPPKLVELERVLDDVFDVPSRKAVLFSEWPAMLDRVEALAATLNLGTLRHSGEVAIEQRAKDLERFAADEDVRLLLCTDLAGEGLNLQRASVVINLDLPWSPSAFRQRVARAWRMEQTEPVVVLNLVCKDSIEERLLQRHEGTSAVAQLVEPTFTPEADAELPWPTVRSFILEQLSHLFSPTPPGPPPLETIRAELHARLGPRLQRMDECNGVLLAVVDQMTNEFDGFSREFSGVEFLAASELKRLRRLVDAGLLTPDSGLQSLFDERPDSADGDWTELAQRQFEDVDAYLEQSGELVRSGLFREAMSPLRSALNLSFEALHIRQTGQSPEPLPLALAGAELVEPGLLPRRALSLAAQCRSSSGEATESLWEGVRELAERVRSLICRSDH